MRFSFIAFCVKGRQGIKVISLPVFVFLHASFVFMLLDIKQVFVSGWPP